MSILRSASAAVGMRIEEAEEKEYELDREGRTAGADEWALAMEQGQDAVP